MSFTNFLDNWEKIAHDKITAVPENAINYSNSFNLQWNNKLAINRVYLLRDLFQRDPDILAPQVGGSVVWFNAPSRVSSEHTYVKVEIEDISYINEKPVTHSDFMRTSIRYQMNEGKAKHI